MVVQELVAPPFAGNYPDGSAYKPDKEAQVFFEAMNAHGFDYILSEEDTGTNDTIHVNSTATEWWVCFYKPDIVEPAPNLPHGYLASDRSNHKYYERVPYAFAFRTLESGTDFVLVPVHLKPCDGSTAKERRQHELASIARVGCGEPANRIDRVCS